MKNTILIVIRAVFTALTLLLTQTATADDVVITLDSPRQPLYGVTPVQQSFILTEAPAAKAVLLLLPGGGGKLRLAPTATLNVNANNFLIRSRYLLAAEGFHTVVMDAASDFLLNPLGLRNNRRTEAHMIDIATVIGYMRNRYPGLPVWLVGTSRGSIAAANAAAVLPAAPSGPDGIVLTATVTRPSLNNDDSIQQVPLQQITVPVLIAHHEDDACYVSPSADVDALKEALSGSTQKVRVMLFDGGLPALSDTCSALDTHGFFGIEGKVMSKIGNWITKKL